MQKKIQLYIIVILTLVYLAPVQIAYTEKNTWGHLVYIFFHANIFHLLGNCYCVYYILNNKTFSWLKTLVILYLLSTLASFTTYNLLPTVGFSAPLFVAIGINFYSSKSKRNYLPLLLTVSITWILFPLVNTPLHVICFALGYFYTIVHYFMKGIRHDRSRLDK